MRGRAARRAPPPRPPAEDTFMLDRALDWIAHTLLVLAAVLAFVLCFIVVADVIGRVLFNTPRQGHARDRLLLDRHHLLPAGRLRHPQRRHDQRRRLHRPPAAARAEPAGGVRRAARHRAVRPHLLGQHRRRRARLDLGRVRGRGRAARPGLAGALRHRRAAPRWRRSATSCCCCATSMPSAAARRPPPSPRATDRSQPACSTPGRWRR